VAIRIGVERSRMVKTTENPNFEKKKIPQVQAEKNKTNKIKSCCI
jgi:hypothetical protein